MASFRDRLTSLDANETPEVTPVRIQPPTERELRQLSALQPAVSKRQTEDISPSGGFRSRLSLDSEEDIGSGEALARGVATGVV